MIYDYRRASKQAAVHCMVLHCIASLVLIHRSTIVTDTPMQQAVLHEMRYCFCGLQLCHIPGFFIVIAFSTMLSGASLSTDT